MDVWTLACANASCLVPSREAPRPPSFTLGGYNHVALRHPPARRCSPAHSLPHTRSGPGRRPCPLLHCHGAGAAAAAAPCCSGACGWEASSPGVAGQVRDRRPLGPGMDSGAWGGGEGDWVADKRQGLKSEWVAEVAASVERPLNVNENYSGVVCQPTWPQRDHLA